MMDNKIVLTSLDRKEALRYMGHKDGPVTDVLHNLMERCEKLVLEEAVPRFLYKVVDIEETIQGIAIADADFFLKGKDIRRHLEGCEKAVIMCATVSAGIDRLIRISQKRDMAEAMAIDALASTAIEQVCEKAGKKIEEALKGYYLTWRYGVGYGDFPIEQQRDILTLLDAPRKIGLNMTGSYMLTPGKSVTAVIGLSKKPLTPVKPGCDNCKLKGRCEFRKEGKFCND